MLRGTGQGGGGNPRPLQSAVILLCHLHDQVIRHVLILPQAAVGPCVGVCPLQKQGDQGILCVIRGINAQPETHFLWCNHNSLLGGNLR